MARWAVTIGRWRGAPVRVHASLPLGLWALAGFQLEPVRWACVLGLLVVHALGHAAVARLLDARLSELLLTGYGGHCSWREDVSLLGRAAIASGGIAAQLCLLGVALGLWWLDAVPVGATPTAVFFVATVSNAWLMGVNLLPIAPLDGAQAWAYPFLLGQATRQRLTTHRNATRLEGTPIDADDVGREAQAKQVAALLLENARKRDDAP